MSGTLRAMFMRELGSGSSIVLLLHGVPSPAEELIPLARALADRHRVLVPDLPGYGDTPAGDPSYAAVTRCLVEALSERGATKLRGIVGFSGGVLRALYLLLRGGIEADVLVSLGGLAGFDAAGRAQMQGFADLARADPSAMRSRPIIEMMSQRMLSPAWSTSHPQDIERVASWLTLTSPKDLADELEATGQAEDFGPELAKVRARLYARVGALDQACPVALSEALAAGVPNGRVEVVPECGHALLIEDAEATIDAVASELAR